VDAALLLALAEVAGGTQANGTLWMDEVFDALDTEGQHLVADALGELGMTRSVVVITHRSDLAKKIPAVSRLHVVDGAVEPR
jgi:DNA repair exonuclease SbcCD ATPase subunit